jgi:hypothetical protein
VGAFVLVFAGADGDVAAVVAAAGGVVSAAVRLAAAGWDVFPAPGGLVAAEESPSPRDRAQ